MTSDVRLLSPGMSLHGPDPYADKALHYFEGRRDDIVGLLPGNPAARILEVGCGNGATGELALAAGKCRTYCGIDIARGPAEAARARLSEVLVGDVEQIELPWEPASFDALILSEVLEHLVDPHRTLRRLSRVLRPGAMVMASSPNAAHYQIILMLLRGEWRAEDSGPMDRTHLRWFTPRTYRRMFESCGYEVESITTVAPMGWKARTVTFLTAGRAFHLIARQMMLRARAI